MKGSLIILGFFIAGTLCGLSGLLSIDQLGFNISFIALAILIFCVGISIGHDIDGLKKDLRSLDPRMLLLPATTIIGTLAGCLAVSLLLPQRSVSDVLAIGSGFGYYSLSSTFITEYRGVELGTIALIANIARELITLIGAPIIYKFFGPLPLSLQAEPRAWTPHYR